MSNNKKPKEIKSPKLASSSIEKNLKNAKSLKKMESSLLGKKAAQIMVSGMEEKNATNSAFQPLSEGEPSKLRSRFGKSICGTFKVKNKVQQELVDKLNEMDEAELREIKKDHDEAVQQDKNRKRVMLITMIIILILIVICVITTFVLMREVIVEDEEDIVPPTKDEEEVTTMTTPELEGTTPDQSFLPDLIEICDKYKGDGSLSNSPHTHLTKYPKNCGNVVCSQYSSAILNNDKIDLEDGYMIFCIGFRNISFQVPLHTPCNVSGWCVNGTCEETNDQRVAEFANLPYPSYDNTWVDTCKVYSFSTGLFTFFDEEKRRQQYTECPENIDEACKNESLGRLTFDIVKINFLMPKPVWPGESKYMRVIQLYTGFVPWYISKLCHTCPNKMNVNEYFEKFNCTLWQPDDAFIKRHTDDICQTIEHYDCYYRCNSDRFKEDNQYVYSLPMGTPCPVKSNTEITTPTYCAFGFCMPVMDKNQPYFKFERSKKYCPPENETKSDN